MSVCLYFLCNHRALKVGSQFLHCTVTCALRAAPFAITVHKAPCLRPVCVHKAFSFHSLFFSVTYSSVSLKYLYMADDRYILLIYYFFLITDATQCKDNSRGTPDKLVIFRSLCVHISLTVRSPLSLRGDCAPCSLTAHR